MNAIEEIQSRHSIVSDTLQSLTDQARRWREKIDLLEAGQQLDRVQALADLTKLLDVCQNLRDAILSEDSAAKWQTKDELHALVARFDEADAKRRRYLDLAQVLATGTVSHRRERTRLERLRLRDAAVAELMEISAMLSAPELPGPAAKDWLQWACSLEDSSNAPDLKILNTNFPRVDDFVRQLEYETWHDGPDAHPAANPAAVNGHRAESTRAIDTATGSMRAEEAPSKRASAPQPDAELFDAAAIIDAVRLPSPEPEPVVEARPAASEVEAKPAASAVDEPLAAREPALPPTARAPRVTEASKLCFFAQDEIDSLSLHLEKASKDPMGERKVRSLLAVSHWLAPLDQNPVLQPRCGIRAQVGYTDVSELTPVSPEVAEEAIEADGALHLFVGGADLLRWSLEDPSGECVDAIAAVRRLTAGQLKVWFNELYKIELAEPQVRDMYQLTYGVPLLVGELHRKVIPIPDAPPTWLGFAIWTKITQSFENRLSAIAEELVSGPPALRLTEREIGVLKMVAIASDDSTPETLASNLMERWRTYHHPEHQALTSADEGSIRVLLDLGLLPMRNESGLRAIKALLPLHADDPMRKIVSFL